MKKLYSTQNWTKAVSLGTVMTALLSSVSPVFAANLAITGATVSSTNGAGVSYPHGSHGSIVFAGDDNYCGADNVVGRGGKQQANAANRITAQEQYNRFIENQEFSSRNPYGTTTEKEVWGGDSWTNTRGGYMGFLTGGIQSAMPEAYGIYSFATGCGSAATGNYSTVFGAGATAKAGGAQAFGVSALAAGKASVAMGVGSEASGESTVAIGGLASALGKNSVAVGTKTKAEKNYAIAIGSEAEAQASGSIAIGSRDSDRTPEVNNPNRKVIAKGENSIAIGTHTYAQEEDSVAIGANAQVTVFDGVAIGGGSVSDRKKGTVGYDPYLDGDSTESGMAWKSTAGAFSVGEVGGRDNGTLTRQITGVAAGSQDTDAVNVAQLKAMRDVIAGGGGWKISVNDENSAAVNAGNTVDFSVKNDNGAGKDNLKIEKEVGENKHKVKFSLSDTLTLTKVTTGKSSMSDDGLVITGGPSIKSEGISAGNKRITNVVDATEDTDAVNYKQLKAVEKATKTSWQLSVNGGDATAIGQNGTVNLQEAKSKNIKIVKDNNHNVTFDLADDIQVMKVTAGESIMDAVGFRFTDGGPSITINGIHAGDKTIKGVAAGTSDTDAVNYKQLKDFTAGMEKGWKLSVNGDNATDVKAGSTVKFVAAKHIDNNDNTNIKIVKSENNEVTFDLNDYIKVNRVETGISSLSNAGLIIKGGPNVTEGGIFAGHKKITGVAAGDKDTDAVNFAQLKEIKNQITVNSLVKWDEGSKLITIGAEKDGAKIDITGSDGDRTIAGVKAAVNDNEAVNKKQLDDHIASITNNIKNVSDFAVLYDKNNDNTVNYESVTLGGNKGKGPVALLNVKDGEISSDSTDAINGSQINQISQNVAKFFGGNAAFENGAFVGPSYNLTTIEDGTVSIKNYSDVGSALDAVNKNVFAVDHSVISGFNYIADYFGGGAKYEKGKWQDPTFQVIQFKGDGTSSKQPYSNVADAFEGVNNTFSAIHNQISNITENSLVQQEGDNGLITVGKATGGTKISIANKSGEARTLSGVKDGTLSKTSTDAVNGSQLFTTNQTVSNLINTLNDVHTNISKYFGGSTDVLSGIEPAFLIQDKTYNNVTDAFTGVNVSIHNIDNKITEMKENNLVQQEGGASGIITIGKKTAGTEISIAGYAGVARSISGVKAAEKGDEAVNKDQLDKSIEKISKDIDLASAAAVLYDKNDDNSVNYSSVTLGGKKNAGPVALLNVKDGRIAANSTDAITGNQLYLMSNQLAAYFGGGAGYKDGKWTAPNFKISQVNADGTVKDQTYQNVADALGSVNSGMVNINNRIDDVINKVDTDALKWNKEKGAYDASHGGQPSKIINVANGRIAKDSKEAVNGGQLWQTNERISDVENKVDHIENRVDNISNTIVDINGAINNIGGRVDNIENTVGELVDGVVLYDRDENGKKTNKVTLKGGNESEPVLIDNVADGRIEKGSKEAVNGGQLHDYTQEQMKIVLDQSKHYTDQRVNNIVIDAIDDAVERANNYTNIKFEALNYSIQNVRKEARQAAAIGLAVSNLRYNDTPGKLSVAFGSGLWRGQSAFALGAGYSSEDGKIRSNLSATSSGGHWGVGVGLNLTLN